MAIAKENDLISSICTVKILYHEFLRYALLLRNVFCIWMSKQFRTLLFLCEHSHQIFCILQLGHLCYCAVGVKAHKEIVRF